MKNTPIDYKTVKETIENYGVEEVGKGSIRDVVKIVNIIEKKTGKKFIRMEMGVPSLAPPEIGTNAEIEALKKGVASKYPMLEGVPAIKKELKRFMKLFLNLDVEEENCVPTVGSMMGGMATFLTAGRREAKKDTILFIDPGFPVQKHQLDVIGMKYTNFDVYNFRGEKLRSKLESILSEGNISCILFSNPNNPTWVCFTCEELKIIAELADKYNCIVIEDLAYFGMDFREDYSKPGEAPYPPSVTNYTDNYIILFSSSKAFSYAGQRIGASIISPKLYHSNFPELKKFYNAENFGYCFVYGSLYTLSSGCSHSAQYAFAAMLKAANDGEFNFLDSVKIYGERAKIMKQMFQKYGFKIVYECDGETPIADGFYFTISYPGFTGHELVEELFYYGISAIALITTGSEVEGLRACVSQTCEDQFGDLEERLKAFKEAHPVE